MVIRDLQVTINREYDMVDAQTDSDFQLPPNTPLLFMISSVGRKISEFSTDAFGAVP